MVTISIDGMTWNRKVACYVLFGFAQVFAIISLSLLVEFLKKIGDISWSISNRMLVHPLLMFLGLVYLQGTAISGFRVLNDVEKLYVKLAHACMHTITFALTVVGLVAIFDVKNEVNGKHLVTFHAWLGLITVILFSAQWFFSFLAFMYPKASEEWRRTLMPYHRACGALSFVLAVINTLVGLYGFDLISTSIARQSEVAVLCPLFALLFGILTVYLVTKKLFKRENVYD